MNKQKKSLLERFAEHPWTILDTWAVGFGCGSVCPYLERTLGARAALSSAPVPVAAVAAVQGSVAATAAPAAGNLGPGPEVVFRLDLAVGDHVRLRHLRLPLTRPSRCRPGGLRHLRLTALRSLAVPLSCNRRPLKIHVQLLSCIFVFSTCLINLSYSESDFFLFGSWI